MGYINVFVSNEAYIYVKNNQLFLENKFNKIDYPLEDVNSVMVENLNTTISTYTLSQLASKGIVCFVCNQNHLPNGVVLPFCEHYQTLIQFQNQVNIPKPLKKQLWQNVIKNKIENQNEVLNICGEYDVLKTLQETVLSGDATNNEAKASLIYFKKLFGKDFARREDSAINSFLNYGYSIIRGFVARSISSHGLLPFLGIFHSNQYNQFNLADDLMEIFRPLVDLYVKLVLSKEKEINTQIKTQLFNLINYDVFVGKQKQPLTYAIDMYVESFQRSIKENKNLLKNIKIKGLEQHQYE